MEIYRKISKKSGLPPGTLMHVGEKHPGETAISLQAYNKNELLKKEICVEECAAYRKARPTVWLNVNGLSDNAIIKEIGDTFDIHSLVLEDIVNTAQHPKIEDRDKYFYAVLKMISFDHGKNDLCMEQLSLVLTKSMLISFQEREGDVFNAVRERIDKGGGRIGKRGPDYLFYSLMDAVVDNYFKVVEKMGEEIELLEDQVFENPEPDTSLKIHALRRKIILLRRSIWPVRDMINTLLHSESSLIEEATRPYLKDIYDHAIQVIETLEIFRDMLASQLEVHLTSINTRMNEVMKVLAIISTLFIPAGVVAGIYGMNFKYMPELDKTWGYPLVLLAMAGMMAGFLIFYKKRNWI
ncbi:magnesium/cobalt transporter CorA [Fibrobacterota bacterium]